MSGGFPHHTRIGWGGMRGDPLQMGYCPNTRVNTLIIGGSLCSLFFLLRVNHEAPLLPSNYAANPLMFSWCHPPQRRSQPTNGHETQACECMFGTPLLMTKLGWDNHFFLSHQGLCEVPPHLLEWSPHTRRMPPQLCVKELNPNQDFNVLKVEWIFLFGDILTFEPKIAEKWPKMAQTARACGACVGLSWCNHSPRVFGAHGTLK